MRMRYWQIISQKRKLVLKLNKNIFGVLSINGGNINEYVPLENSI